MQGFHTPSNPDLLEVPVGSLNVGMFVAELDRPWLETPFAMQGFYIREEADIDYIAEHCAYVYVDPQKKTAREPYPKHAVGRRKTDPDPVSIKREFGQAKVDFASASQTMEKVFAKITKNRRVDVDSVRVAIVPLIDSVFRNREAMAALIRMKDKSDYHYQHSISVAVWSAILGRHLGMSRDQLVTLAMGASMMDVGMTTIADELTNKKGKLDAQQIEEIRGHVKESVKIVSDSGLRDAHILDVLACHHERYDASGYPLGLQSSQIPPMARIAGLVDTYDAMITQRPHAAARASYEAMLELNDLKDILFQGSLVEQFMQAVGMYPTGSIVELNTGEVGVVVTQNSSRRLRPKVVMILDADKNKLSQLTQVDLSKYSSVSDGMPALWITKELPAGAYGVRAEEYFLS